MTAEFKFYNVGQGTFYGGAIELNEQKFVIVYDCGSVTGNNPLRQPITDFRNEFDHIDLLIVSHFDSDHVNGIRDLIIGIPVALIVLPYMPLMQRLALVIGQEEEDSEYNSLLANPTEYFLNNEIFDIASISFVDQGENVEGDEVLEPDENPKFDRDIDENFEFGELFIENPENDDKVQEKILNDDPDLNGNNVSFLPFNSRLVVGIELWEFLLYHRKTNEETDVEDFIRAVNQYKEDEGNISTGDLFSPTHRANMKKLYEDHIAGDVNYSSLCVFHGPLFRSHIGARVHVLPNGQNRDILFPWRWRHRRWRLGRAGTILTGDQFLKTNSDFTPFYNYFINRMSRTEIYQVPHHGSANNWREMPNELNQHDIGCYVINHGYGRVHHPNPSVLQNILTFISRDVVLNNERTLLEYWIRPIIRRR